MGSKGEIGLKGQTGLPGNDGVQGSKGDVGAVGANGPKGPRGNPGMKGQTGESNVFGSQVFSAFKTSGGTFTGLITFDTVVIGSDLITKETGVFKVKVGVHTCFLLVDNSFQLNLHGSEFT